MKIMVTGGRDYANRELLYSVLDQTLDVIEVLIHGACKDGGADILAEEWAKSREVPYMGFPARWSVYNKAAGPKRNVFMLQATRPDILVAFPGGNGTANCVLNAHKLGINVREIHE